MITFANPVHPGKVLKMQFLGNYSDTPFASVLLPSA